LQFAEKLQAGTCGPQFKVLAPKFDFFSDYKAGKIDECGYIEQYCEKVLKPLDPKEIYDRICANYGADATLLCYEKPGDFCHRHIVAHWFETQLGIVVPELTFDKNKNMESLIEFR
jgi:hypothetical protein